VSSARPLRVLLVANDGFSAGHVARAIAIARGLVRVAARRDLAVAAVLATTSEAHALLASEPLAIVTLPAPVAARRAGLSDAERRTLVRAALDGVVEGFSPDLLVVDTFPSGPHGELAGLRCRARRALVRRSVPGVPHDALTAGLGDYDLAVLAGDPAPLAIQLPVSVLHVPPITLAEARDGLDRDAARARLGLADGRAILVAAGGGGDRDAAARAWAIAEAIVRVAPDVTPVVALGPLVDSAAGTPEPVADGSLRTPEPAGGGRSLRTPVAALAAAPGARIRVLRIAPLQPVLAAFDGAFSAAGYNTAHELAKARVPAALFAQPRPFDDQAGRAARFAMAGFACALATVTDEAVAAALAWMQGARVPELAAGGADRAAEGLLDLATGRTGARDR
jgi:UDP-N-acetylglucosamine--N-acetylmuramyl-(pentapeptide) pyrophosphoryl-undecaprenol N-acetylglucosamine transferase